LHSSRRPFCRFGWCHLRDLNARLERPGRLQKLVRVEVLHKVLLSAPLHFGVELDQVITDGLLPLRQLPFSVLSHSCGTSVHLVVIVD
jgi:hypothetical protein